MRIKIMIPLLLAFSFLVLNAYSILEPSEVSTGGGESLADKLLNASQGEGIYRQFEAFSEGIPQISRSQGNESATAFMSDTTIADSSAGSQTPRSSLVNTVAGTWSLDLNDTVPKQAELTLFQVENKVFGAGNMKNKSMILMVAASGSVQDDKIYLDITSVGTISLYSLVMKQGGERSDFVSGDYKAYTPDGRTWMGKVQGRRSLPIS